MGSAAGWSGKPPKSSALSTAAAGRAAPVRAPCRKAKLEPAPAPVLSSGSASMKAKLERGLEGEPSLSHVPGGSVASPVTCSPANMGASALAPRALAGAEAGRPGFLRRSYAGR